MSDRVRRAFAVAGPALGVAAPVHPSNPLWGVTAITGIPRLREWEASAAAVAPGLPGEAVHFVALASGDLIVDEDVPDGSVEPLARAIEATLNPPYRARAVRHDDRTWAVGAVAVDVIEIAEPLDGDEFEVAVTPDGVTRTVDAEPVDHPLDSLEAWAGARHEHYVAIGRRLDERLWEVEISPL